MSGFPLTDPRRWLDELREMQARHPSLGLCGSAVGGRVGGVELRLTWPIDYPLRPPMVWLEGDYRGYLHVFEDGSLCLYPHNAEEGWRPDYTAADAVDRAIELGRRLQSGEVARARPVPSRLGGLLYVPPALAEAMRAGVQFGAVGGYHRADNSLGLVTWAEGGRRVLQRAEEDPGQGWRTAAALDQQWDGAWVRANTPDVLASREQLLSSLPAAAREFLSEKPALLVVGDRELRLVWMREQDNRVVSLYYVPVVERSLPADLDARNPGPTPGDAAVALVGLGSLGSQVALALARAGVRRFYLVDPDVLEVANVGRHACDLHEVGRTKVAAVARAILRVRPDAAVLPIVGALSAEPARMNGAVDQLAPFWSERGPKLMVATTATAGVESLVNHLALSRQVPAVFGAVLGPAEHGRVYRVLPGESACHACVVAALQAGEDVAYTQEEVARYGGGLPGVGVDVTAVATLAARHALQTLARGSGQPDAHGDHIVWSRPGTWGVDGPLQVRFPRIQRRADCPACGSHAPELTPEERAELTELVKLLNGDV